MRELDATIGSQTTPADTLGEDRPAPSKLLIDPPPFGSLAPEAGAADADPPTPTPLDAGESLDAGGVAPGDAEPPCAGVRLFGICWYVGAVGASCNQTCASHGGYAEAATSRVGTALQGGSAVECSAILQAIREATPAEEGNRLDGAGVGCHMFGGQRDPYWLVNPDFDPSSQLRLARVVCGCQH